MSVPEELVKAISDLQHQRAEQMQHIKRAQQQLQESEEQLARLDQESKQATLELEQQNGKAQEAAQMIAVKMHANRQIKNSVKELKTRINRIREAEKVDLEDTETKRNSCMAEIRARNEACLRCMPGWEQAYAAEQNRGSHEDEENSESLLQALTAEYEDLCKNECQEQPIASQKSEHDCNILNKTQQKLVAARLSLESVNKGNLQTFPQQAGSSA